MSTLLTDEEIKKRDQSRELYSFADTHGPQVTVINARGVIKTVTPIHYEMYRKRDDLRRVSGSEKTIEVVNMVNKLTFRTTLDFFKEYGEALHWKEKTTGAVSMSGAAKEK